MKRMLIILMMLLSPVALAQIIFRGLWFVGPPLPTARQNMSAAALDGKIYVIGGLDASGASTNIVEVLGTSGWSSVAPLPIATHHNAAAVAGGRLYAFGGTSNRTFVYDPQANSWFEAASMNFLHGDTPAVGVINGKIYVAGGTGPNMNQTEAEVYDTAANTWTQIASMNVPRSHTAGGSIFGKFYVAGGRGSESSSTALEAYDPVTNRWARLADMPSGSSDFAAAVVNGELYVFGGEGNSIFGTYNPLTNRWQLSPSSSIEQRHGIFAAVIDDRIYFPGGATQPGLSPSNINQVFSAFTATTVSAASFSTGIAPRAIVAAFGRGFTTMSLAATTQPLPTELGGMTVEVTDSGGITRLAPLFSVTLGGIFTPDQVNYQIPPGTATGPAIVVVFGSRGQVSTGVIEVIDSAPAIFTLSQNGRGAAAALDAINYTSAPFNATRADGQPNIITFFGTGLGEDATDVNVDVSISVQALIDGNPATVLYAGPAPGFTGLNQLNLLLPVGTSSGTHEVQFSRHGFVSNTVTIEIK